MNDFKNKINETTNKTCGDCSHFTHYDSASFPNLGFCNRFKETANKTETDCIGFSLSKKTENHYRNLVIANQKKIDLQQQINFDE